MFSLVRRLRFWSSTQRIEPDIPLTHWMLFFPGLGARLARRKLCHFGINSEIRPFAFLVGTHNIEIGARVVIRPNCMLMANDGGRIIIGNDVLIGSATHFTLLITSLRTQR